jgi:hypothetical protein
MAVLGRGSWLLSIESTLPCFMGHFKASYAEIHIPDNIGHKEKVCDQEVIDTSIKCKDRHNGTPLQHFEKCAHLQEGSGVMDVLGELLLHLMGEDTNHSDYNGHLRFLGIKGPSQSKDENQVSNKCHLFEQKT